MRVRVSAHISTYVEPDLKEALDALARADGRSLADAVRRILRDHVRQAQR